MSPTLGRLAQSAQRFPRVSGDEPTHVLVQVSGATFSPRERG